MKRSSNLKKKPSAHRSSNKTDERNNDFNEAKSTPVKFFLLSLHSFLKMNTKKTALPLTREKSNKFVLLISSMVFVCVRYFSDECGFSRPTDLSIECKLSLFVERFIARALIPFFLSSRSSYSVIIVATRCIIQAFFVWNCNIWLILWVCVCVCVLELESFFCTSFFIRRAVHSTHTHMHIVYSFMIIMFKSRTPKKSSRTHTHTLDEAKWNNHEKCK